MGWVKAHRVRCLPIKDEGLHLMPNKSLWCLLLGCCSSWVPGAHLPFWLDGSSNPKISELLSPRDEAKNFWKRPLTSDLCVLPPSCFPHTGRKKHWHNTIVRYLDGGRLAQWWERWQGRVWERKIWAKHNIHGS